MRNQCLPGSYQALFFSSGSFLFSPPTHEPGNEANLCSVHKPCPLLRELEETVPAARVVHFPGALSVVPRPMNVVLGLGTRLRVRMRTKLENGVLHNEQQPQSVVNGFY